jgi:ribosomal protein L11 methyltransferase
MAPEVARHLVPGGVAILSGLLRSQARGVEAIYAGHGLRCEDRIALGEWVSLLLRKR